MSACYKDLLRTINGLNGDTAPALLRLDPLRIGGIYPTRAEDRSLVRLAEVPRQLTETLIAVEDSRFHDHHGVDPLGILRAAWSNLIAGRSGIRPIDRFDVADMPARIAGMLPEGEGGFRATDFLEAKDLKKNDLFIVYGIAAAAQALADAGYAPGTEEQKERAGVMIGSGIGGLQTIAETAIVLETRGPRRVSPFFIPAALITGIRSDLPGQITAQVTQHIYDSPTGSMVLIPQGTRIIGEYSSDVGFGDRRVLLVWNRLIFPNGRSIVLERQPGADPQGYAGIEDGVDYHWWDLAKAAGLSTLLSVGAELTMDDDERLIQAIRNGAQDTINDAGQQIVQRQLQVAPTLTIRPGFPVRVIVTRDLVLEPYGN